MPHTIETHVKDALNVWGHVPRQGDWITYNGEEHLVYKAYVWGYDETKPDTYICEEYGPKVTLQIIPKQQPNRIMNRDA